MNRAACLCAAGILLSACLAYAQDARVFRGEVSDSQCALNVHSLTRSHRRCSSPSPWEGRQIPAPDSAWTIWVAIWFYPRATMFFGWIVLIWCTVSRDKE